MDEQRIDFPLPPNLPRPSDDGAADHLWGMRMPNISLRSTSQALITLSDAVPGRRVIYCYPRTGVPGEPLPENWDAIPGARGCTPQACNFRDHYPDLRQMGVEVFGLSTQSTEYQREMVHRLGLPFEVLSDSDFLLCDALRLPTFRVGGMRLLKRLTLIVKESYIEHVLYPVFPPNESAAEVLRWLTNHAV